MSAFPTLSSAFQTFPESPVDDTIASPAEAGYQQTRPRFTRSRRTFGPIKMILSRSDRDTLIAFDATVKGSVIFTVTHPITGATLNVRFSKDGRVKTEPIFGSNPINRQFTAEFTLEEA